MESQTQEPQLTETHLDELTPQELGLKLDNMLIKLHRITAELGSLTYQAREIKQLLTNKESIQ